MNMKRECLREYLKNQGDKTLKAKDSGSLNPKIKIWILFCRPCSFPTEVVDKLIKYQVNSFWVIVSVILTTALFNKTLILQREIWCWSLLGFNELKTFYNHLNFRDRLISFFVDTTKMIICKQIWYHAGWGYFIFIPASSLSPPPKNPVSYCASDLVKTVLLGGRSRTVDQSHSFFLMFSSSTSTLMPTIWFSPDHKWEGNSFHFYSDSVVIWNKL